MDKQEFNREFQNRLNTEFQKIDAFLGEFRSEFIHSSDLILKHENSASVNEISVHDKLRLYADQIWNCAESTLDKDRNYSESRLKDELEAITTMMEKGNSEIQLSLLSEQLHQNAKAVMVKFFPDLFELSANGFRLLEKYCLIYNMEFTLSLESN